MLRSALSALDMESPIAKESVHLVVSNFFIFILFNCLITYTIEMKVEIIIYMIQCTIYFTFESILFRGNCHWCFKGEITINRKRRKRLLFSGITLCHLMEQLRPKTGNPFVIYFCLYMFVLIYCVPNVFENPIITQYQINCLHNTKEVW